MKAIVGDENGVLKIVDCCNKQSQYTCFGEQDRSRSVVELTFINDNELGILRKDGSFDINSISKQGALKHKTTIGTGLVDPIGSSTLSSAATTFCFGAGGQVVSIGRDHSCTNFEVRSPISCGSAILDGISFAGNENDVSIYDLNTFQPVWEAENVSFSVDIHLQNIEAINLSF